MGCGTHAVGRFFKCSEDLEMKKLAMTAIAAATVLCAGAAQAYTVGTFSNGVVVPNVIHNGPTNTTAVGLINRSGAGAVRAVYWTFFDQDSNHVTDGCFPMTDSDFQPFVWSSESGTGLEGQRGYLVFALGTSFTGITAATACSAASAAGIAAPGANARLAANAFQVDATNKDVAYIPVVDGPLTLAGNLTTLGPTSLTLAAGAAAVGQVMNMRYFIDGATGGTDTLIAVWSTGDQRGTHTVNMFDDKQARKSVNFKLDHTEFDWFNPETIPGRPAGFVDGFIEWNTGVVPGDYLTLPGAAAANALATARGSVFTFSVINSPAFGAMQTVLGAHHAP